MGSSNIHKVGSFRIEVWRRGRFGKQLMWRSSAVRNSLGPFRREILGPRGRQRAPRPLPRPGVRDSFIAHTDAGADAPGRAPNRGDLSEAYVLGASPIGRGGAADVFLARPRARPGAPEVVAIGQRGGAAGRLGGYAPEAHRESFRKCVGRMATKSEGGRPTFARNRPLRAWMWTKIGASSATLRWSTVVTGGLAAFRKAGPNVAIPSRVWRENSGRMRSNYVDLRPRLTNFAAIPSDIVGQLELGRFRALERKRPISAKRRPGLAKSRYGPDLRQH